ncbi:dimethylarginine dimethylaminohydrolase family protein [Paraliomyxa miuraensis]|uniref:dimethylarginine dimethylaminohydrolase family protein n=1 Tax=Paraliomyxa miuraensis TaxID=376150 RepID=UPI00224CFFF5|nr:arginine deiminase family protein [Paraliomyxa miuraensis]MCX4245629.1 arginine deiminase family protein [Paraliomyxa miuraensis]
MDEGPDPRVELAQRQHEDYVAALREAGIEIEVLAPEASLPDACFVEDAAVILSHDVAVLSRTGAPSRRDEVATLEPVLARRLTLHRLEAPATLDGGDVLRLGDRFLVGRSSRTNDAGIEQLRRFGEPLGLGVEAVDVAAGLHLKSACTALDDRTVVVDPDALDPAVLEALGLVVHRVPEPVGANVLALGDRVLVSADAEGTATQLEASGRVVVRVPLSEIHRGDGALSCLSLRLPPPGGWSV